MIMTGFFLIGFTGSALQNKKIVFPGKGYYLVKVVSLPAEKPNSIHYQLKLIANVEKLQPAQKKYYINAYFPKSSQKAYPKPGELLLIHATLSAISNLGNPDEFDYALYLRRKNIYSSCFIDDKYWTSTSIQYGTGKLRSIALNLKQDLQEKILKVARDKKNSNYHVMMAICTGDKSHLNKEIREVYSNAGAIHVMAVSGLHVGMIWIFISYLTIFLKRSKYGRILQFLLVIFLLWLFALITGLSASVTRSCTMFSIASFAGIINRRSLIFNSVFVSALIQLSLNPIVLYDTGFQFSYCAVLGILLFQPPIKSIFKSNNFILRKLIDLISVSLAAQFLTFSLAVFYFHQFPVYFLLTNIFIIPLLSILMITFLGSIMCFFIPSFSSFLIHVSLKITGLMSQATSIINAFPFTTLENLQINYFQLFILLLLPLFVLLFYHYKRPRYVLASSALILFLVYSGILVQREKDPEQLCILNLRNKTAIDINYGSRHVFLHSDSISDASELEFMAFGYWLKNFNKNPEVICLDHLEQSSCSQNFTQFPGNGNYIFCTRNKKIAIVQDPGSIRNYMTSELLSLDLLITGGKSIFDLEHLLKIFTFPILILDSSVPAYTPKPTFPDSLNIYIHRISNQGAFMMKL
jgi:competence protein ComEC